jgi:hypothetical protein
MNALNAHLKVGSSAPSYLIMPEQSYGIPKYEQGAVAEEFVGRLRLAVG